MKLKLTVLLFVILCASTVSCTNLNANEDRMYEDSVVLSGDMDDKANSSKTVQKFEEDGDAVCFVEKQMLQVGENELTEEMVILGEGWSGSLEQGFVHRLGYTEPLVFDLGASDGESYLVEGNYTYSREGGLSFSLGDSFQTDPYNGTSTLQWGLTCVGDDGELRLIPDVNYDGMVTRLTCRKISEAGENEVEVLLANIQHTELAGHLSGFWNIAMGQHALESSINGTRNLAMGYYSERALKTGGRNIGLGTFTMSQMQNGNYNVGIGADAMLAVQNAENCVAVGYAAMYNGSKQEGNIAIGSAALYGAGGNDVSSTDVVAIGNGAGYYGGGKANVFVGNQAGYKNTSVLNTFIGTQAGKEASGWGCTAIGNQSTTGSYSQSTVIGQGAKATKSKQVVIGSDDVEETVVKGDLIVRGTDGILRQIIFNADGTCSWEEVQE